VSTVTPHTPQSTHADPHRAAPHRSRLSVWLAGAGVASLLALTVAPGLITTAAAEETGEQRCARQTAEYNAAMDSAWRAAHPGQTPPAGAWPPFVCQDIPTPEVPVPGTGGGTSGDSTGAQRDHHYEGFDSDPGEYAQDMSVGGPRTGLADRSVDTGTDTTNPSAGDTARSNVPTVTPWATPREDTLTDDDGNPRRVRVVDTDAGPVVINDDGTATGQILDPTAPGGVTTRQGLAGIDLLTDNTGNNDSTGNNDGDNDSDRDAASATTPTVAPGVPGTDGSGGDTGAGTGGGGRFDPRDPTSPIGPGPVGALGAAAGGAGVLINRRRRDGATRADIDWGAGREQSLILVEGPESPREYRFAMDVPDGGQMVKNPDGSVDVLDADGTVVEHVKSPWAYDAAGRAVPTYYEVDNTTGALVQVVDPQRTTMLPVLADPDKKKQVGGTRQRGGPGATKPASAARGTGKTGGKQASKATSKNTGTARTGAPKNPKSMPDNSKKTGTGRTGAPEPTAAATTPSTPKAVPKNVARAPKPAPISDEQRRAANNASAAASTGNNDPAKLPKTPGNNPGNTPRTSVGIIDTTGHHDGDTWTEDLGNGETATHTIVDGTGGQTVDTHIEHNDGTFTDNRSVRNDLGGWESYSNNSDGTAAYAQSNQDEGTHYAEHYDAAPVPGYTPTPQVTSQGNADNSQGTAVANNPNGTQSYGAYQRTADNRYDMAVANPDDTVSEVNSTQRDDAGVSTLVSDQQGSRVTTDGHTTVPVDMRGNDTSQTGSPDPATGRFYNPATGHWNNGAIDPDTGARTFRLSDGQLLTEVPQEDGTSAWHTRDADGRMHQVDSLGWDPVTGAPVDVVEGKDITPDTTADKGNARDGFTDAAKDSLRALAPLVGLGGDGAPGVAESWANLGTSTATLAGARGDEAQHEALVDLGKDMIAYDDFARGDVDYAAGRATFNILSTLVGTRGAGTAARGTSAAADAGRAGALAGEAGRAGNLADDVGDAAARAARPATPAPKPPTTTPNAAAPHRTAIPQDQPTGQHTAPTPAPAPVAPPRAYAPVVPEGMAGPRTTEVSPNLGTDVLPDGHDPFGGGDLAEFIDRGFWNPEAGETGAYNWPPRAGGPLDGMDGAIPGTVQDIEVQAGTQIDRIGHPGGRFFGDPGDTVGQRSLAPSTPMDRYTVLEFTRDIPIGDGDFVVRVGEVAPWFNQPGGGLQFQVFRANNLKSPLSMKDLIGEFGILRDIGPRGENQ
jgi:hypothetical protein